MANWLESATDALNALPVHHTVREVEWVVPAVQTVHILAVSIIFSSSLVIALRSFGLVGLHWPLARWQQRVEPWIAVALLLLVLSGAVMILAEPERELLNMLFQIKMPLVVIAAVLAFALGRGVRHAPGNPPVSGGARLVALLIVLLWVVVIGLGRWIAYAG